MSDTNQIIGCFETHDFEGIRACFESSVDPNEQVNGEPLFDYLTSTYYRSVDFKLCVRLFVEYGFEYENKALLAVLMDDADTLTNILVENPELVHSKHSIRCAYTPLLDATLLHFCAEFNHSECAEILIKYEADVNEKAGVDRYGFGGQTPIFHTVNQNLDRSHDMMFLLLDPGAKLEYTIKGLIWGKGFEWETFIPSVNPISYAMMGLLPQMHREERTIAQKVSLLIKRQYGIDYLSDNVPNKYVNS